MTVVRRLTPPVRRGRTPTRPGAETAQVQSLTRGLSILECLARTEGADLMVLSAHGRGAVRRMMVGSVASGLIRAGVAPILALRRRDRA